MLLFMGFRSNIIAIILAFTVLSLTPAVSDAQTENSHEWRTFLDNLSGTWKLTGTMGQQELHQRCEGKWVLQNNFFQMDCTAIPPDTSGYKAKYLIGYQTDKNYYIFHLFDVFDGGYSETLGIGTLDDNSITFVFDYPQGVFRNIFVWNESNERWKMILKQKNSDGDWELFSEKTLKKINN